MAELRLVGLSHETADGSPTVDDVDLHVADGETLALIGPSGCGKTTVIRLIAGLATQTRGAIVVGGRRIEHLPSRDRRMGYVAQSRVVPRRQTVRDHISFPTRLRNGMRRGGARVEEEARALSIEELLDERTGRLSGGAQRMMQSARALVEDPDVLLLDEPFTMVDRHSKVRLRRELGRRMQQVTTLLVTADQEDAMALADRIAVMFDGRIRQVGAPMDVYRRPATAAVADFLGDPGMALLPASVRRLPSGFELGIAGERITAWSPELARHEPTGVLVGFRPEHVSCPPRPGHLPVAVVVDLIEPMGSKTILHVTTADRVTFPVAVAGAGRHQPGDRLHIGVDERRLHLFDRVSGAAIFHPADSFSPT